MRKTLGVIFLVIGTGLSGLALPPPPDVSVTTIISDYDSGVAPALQIQSDQAGAYNNSNTLTSIIASTGVWALDSLTPRGATRTVSLQFTKPIAGTGPNGGDPVAPASGLYKVWMYSSCNHQNYLSSFLTLPAGQTMPCPLTVQFDAGGVRYFLHMNDRAIDFPETNHVDVTCIFPTSGTNPCSQWLIRPSGTYAAPDGTMYLRNVVSLSYQKTSKGKTTWVRQGNFHMSFAIVVSKP
jgi:hypothetical protein